METWVCVGWVLTSNGDMGVCWVGAESAMETWVCVGWLREREERCVLSGCRSRMEAWVRAGWVLISNGDMGACCASMKT